MKSFKNQAQNSDQKPEIKNPEGDKFFIGYDEGYLLEYSTTKQTVRDLGKILDRRINSMAKTSDNKS